MSENLEQNNGGVNIEDIMSNVKNTINETLNQRLSPIEQKFNQPTQEQLDQQNEKIRSEFENNPSEFIKNIQTQAKEQALNEVKSKYEPIINKLSWKEAVGNFVKQNPEAEKHMPQITQVLQENPGLMNTRNPLDSAYKMAVANNLMGSGGDVVQGILSNAEYKQKIMQNQQLREEFRQEYLKELNSNQPGTAPSLMGNNPGGSIPASGGETPRSLKEAKQSALRRLQGYNG